MKRIVLIPAFIALAAVSTGCANSARIVSSQGDLVVIAIPENTNDWPTHYRRQADDIALRELGPNFERLSGITVPTGVSTTNSQQVQREKAANGLPIEKDTVTASTTTQQLSEYQITYRRKPGVTTPSPTGMKAGSNIQQASGLVPSVMPPSKDVVQAGGIPPKNGYTP